MARKDGSFVLQDVDDIVEGGSKNPYKDQVEWFKHHLANHHKLPFDEIDRAWQIDMFPRDSYTIRYPIIGTFILFESLGFDWRRDCAGVSLLGECVLLK